MNLQFHSKVKAAEKYIKEYEQLLHELFIAEQRLRIVCKIETTEGEGFKQVCTIIDPDLSDPNVVEAIGFYNQAVERAQSVRIYTPSLWSCDLISINQK